MIYFNSCIYTSNKEGRIVCRIKEHQKIKAFIFDKRLRAVHRHIISVSKVPRRTPYRLLTSSEKFYIDTYPTCRFLVRKPTGEKVIKRIGEIRDEEEFVLWVNGYWRYEKPISFFRDSAVSRFYDIKIGLPALVPVNHFMMQIDQL